MSAFRRHLTSRVMTALVVVLSFTAVLALLLILGNLIAKGASSIDWAFFTKSPVAAGQSGGGVANAIVGTAVIVGLAALIGVPIGVGAGMYLAEYGAGRLGFLVRFIADVHAREGALTLFIRHTSASLTIQENADPSVLVDLTTVLARLAPDSLAHCVLRRECAAPH